MPVRWSYDATDWRSHSSARGAVHGASSGTCFAVRSIRICASAIDDDGERADLRDEAGVVTGTPAVDEQVRPRDPRLVRRRAHLVREAEDRVVPRREPRAAAVDRRAVVETLGPDPAADAVARFEDGDRLPGLLQAACRGQPGVPGAHDAHLRSMRSCSRHASRPYRDRSPPATMPQVVVVTNPRWGSRARG